MSIKDLIQSADFKSEKHVPVIDAADSIKPGESIEVTVTVGKEIAHPNTTEHHIAWIELYFKPTDGKFPYQVAKVDLAAHGASAEGPNTSTVYTDTEVKVKLKTEKSGTLTALSYCNIHGLWESSKVLTVN